MTAVDTGARSVSDLFEPRAADLTLTEEQQALTEVVAKFLESGRGAARAAQGAGGFDPDLFRRFAELGVYGIGISEALGGAGATLVELALVAEQVGRFLAPVSFVDAVAAARIAAAPESSSAGDALAELLSGSTLTTLAFRDTAAQPRQIVPSGAAAGWLVHVHDGQLRLSRLGEHPSALATLGQAPLARFDDLDIADHAVLASGSPAAEAMERGVREWRALSGAALAGLAAGALALAVDFASIRHTRGVPIGSLQAISHLLATCRIKADVARNLAVKASWFLSNEPESAGVLDLMAHTSGAHAATFVSTSAVHVHGGAGVALESDVSLYFERAKSWSVVAGDPRANLVRIGRALFTGAA